MPDTFQASTPPRPGVTRIAWVDAARGVALVAMILYHAGWDLSELRLIETDVARHPAWMAAARAIAASFLTLVGVGLVLGHGDGLRLGPFLRRLVLVAAAALAVTIATVLVAPESFIFFGILHNIALSSLLALPLARAPALATAGLAAMVWAVPALVDAPVLDAPALTFLGLGSRIPNTNDYVPVFPWTGFVFAGMAGARLGRVRLAAAAPAPGWAGRALAWLGRRSLLVYLVHQPVLYGALWAVLQVTGPNPVAEAAPFTRACLSGCARRAGPASTCEAGCACAVAALKREDLWAVVLKGRPSEDEATRASAATRACFAPAR